METIVKTWRDAYFLCSKSINSQWPLLLYIFLINCVPSAVLILGLNGAFAPNYISIPVIIGVLLLTIYLTSLYYKIFHDISNNTHNTIGGVIKFVNKKYLTIIVFYFLFFLFSAAVIFISPLIDLLIGTKNATPHIASLLLDNFFHIYFPLVIPLVLFDGFFKSLKGNLIKSILIIYLPMLINEILFPYYYPPVGALLAGIIYTFTIPVIFVHLNNLFKEYKSKPTKS